MGSQRARVWHFDKALPEERRTAEFDRQRNLAGASVQQG